MFRLKKQQNWLISLLQLYALNLAFMLLNPRIFLKGALVLSQVILKARIVSFSEIQNHVIRLKKHKKTIAFTNGCFDILHPGHIQILEQARKMADYLIVGVNTDASVKRLKGLGRPIQVLTSRMALLASLRAVDCVVSFSQDTPQELIEKILPDVLVKGGDYTIEQIVGAEIVKQNGGRVEIIPTLQGFSTTNIAEQLRN